MISILIKILEGKYTLIQQSGSSSERTGFKFCPLTFVYSFDLTLYMKNINGEKSILK